jgi:multidrug transporter EmrE-like cation transporter
MNYSWHDFIGNIGVAVVILCYLALQLERIDSRSVLYSALNGFGAALVTLSLMFEFNLSAFVVEVFWVLISVYGIVRQLKAKNALRRTRTDGTAEP